MYSEVELYKKAYESWRDLSTRNDGDWLQHHYDELLEPCNRCKVLHSLFSRSNETQKCMSCNQEKCLIGFEKICLSNKSDSSTSINNICEANEYIEVVRSDDSCEECCKTLHKICSACLSNPKIRENLLPLKTCARGCCFMCQHVDPADYCCAQSH
jgi:hypothetical protein